VAAGRGLPATGGAGTPLARKLGLEDGQAVAFVALPEALTDLVAAADFAAVCRLADWRIELPERPLDLVLAFTRRRADLEAGLAGLAAAIRPAGMIWVAWPKRAARVETDVTEDGVRDVALPLGLVDVKVCAVDATWSGLKLVIRKDRR
jgi:hypothetical protein